jgi:hypothetical protein
MMSHGNTNPTTELQPASGSIFCAEPPGLVAPRPGATCGCDGAPPAQLGGGEQQRRYIAAVANEC